MVDAHKQRLFWACFIALVATAFGFIIRAMIINDWGTQFGLTETEKGEIFGVGLWPFAVSIVLFSLIIDKIGYGRAMVFAFCCHVASAIITFFAQGYWSLYWGTFIVALGNGTVEAVINPVVATMFAKEGKTKWLNILHAGWPGGLVLGGIITISMGTQSWIEGVALWQLKVLLILLPTVIYGVMMLSCKFPVNERVLAGVSYRDMLRETGFGGALIVVFLIVWEIGRVIEEGWSLDEKMSMQTLAFIKLAVVLALSGGFGAYVGSLGRPMFIFLLLIMIPLATTELGTDSWITDLLQPLAAQLNFNSGWVLVYTSFIMMVLRFFAGPIVHRLSPLGLLSASSLVAAIGLVALSFSSFGWAIFLAATIYGLGKTFFWPTMLGVAAEQFPRGGALTLNTVGGVGMLGVGVLGTPFLGYIQNTRLEATLQTEHPTVYEQVIDEEPRTWILAWAFGPYKAVDEAALAEQPDEVKSIVTNLTSSIKQNALRTVALFPCIMLICYLILIGYFRSKGGYQAEVLVGHDAEDAKFTGGVAGPVE